MYDYIVVGAGFAGAVIAQQLATKFNKKVLVLEQRAQVGGNAYDEYDKYGFLIQKYGPHIIYTNSDFVIDYLTQFDEFIQHDCVMQSFLDNSYVQLPFNFKSIQQMIGYKKARLVIDGIKKNYDCSRRISIFDLMNDSDENVKEYGNLLYKKAFETYICKQWGLNPDQISKDVINRCSFSPNYVDRYLDRDFQYLPKHGFTYLISKMLEHENIELKLNFNALDHIKIIDNVLYYDGEVLNVPLVYTGGVDALFGFKYGKLPYRSLRFEETYYKEKKVLPCEIISMPQDPKFIRKTEYKYFSPFITKEDEEITVVVTEEPYQYDYKLSSIQCYPIINDDNNSLYEKYKQDSIKVKNLHLCGRLAEYKYYNMDAVILHAYSMAQDLGNQNK